MASAAPGAYVRRLTDNPGFGAAANEVLEVFEGAAFYLVCHDDIAPEPDVVRVLVVARLIGPPAVVVAGDETVDFVVAIGPVF